MISSIDGRKILLKDICTIQEQWPENRFYAEYNGRRSVWFNVKESDSEDVVAIVENAGNL